MDDYIGKPLQRDVLAAALERARGRELFVGQPQNSAPLSTIDLAALGQFSATIGERGPYIVREMIASYLDDTPNLIASMRAAAARADRRALRTAAHRLKSSSAAVKALALSELCRMLEEHAGDEIATDWQAEVRGIADINGSISQTMMVAAGRHHELARSCCDAIPTRAKLVSVPASLAYGASGPTARQPIA
jgi:HPt (histidine-containing phosphotransfer) domain-containing protein